MLIRCLDQAAIAAVLRFLRQPKKPIAPRPVAKNGSADGSGVTDTCAQLPRTILISAALVGLDEREYFLGWQGNRIVHLFFLGYGAVRRLSTETHSPIRYVRVLGSRAGLSVFDKGVCQSRAVGRVAGSFWPHGL